MEDKEFCTYLNHDKFVRVVINKENKDKIEYILDFITENITLKKRPNTEIENNKDGINITVYWDFNYVLVVKWLAIEAVLKKRLRILYKRNLIEAFLITWI